MARAADGGARGGATAPEPAPTVAGPRTRCDDGTGRPVDGRPPGTLVGWRGAYQDLFGAQATTNGPERPPTVDPGIAGDRPDTSTAPRVVAPGPEELRKRRISGRRRWYAGSLVGLCFLVIAMVQAATSGGSVASIVAFEVLAVAYGACYMLAPVRVAGGFDGTSAGPWGKLAAIGLMVTISVPMIVIGGTGVTGLWIYIGVAGAIMFPLAWAMSIAAVLAVAMLVTAALAGAALPWELALTLAALTLWMAGFAGNIRLTIELRDTRDELARAAVAAERARIGRDLHDILGHSLTAIAVKAGLSRRLLERTGGPDLAAASAEIGDVERLAREALSDVRATAAGYRDVSLAGELAMARSVLQAAGIRADLPTAVDDVDPAGREVFGYVVREAVTNVLRHSGASHCAIELTRRSVQITDDGHPPPGAPPGSTKGDPAIPPDGALRGGGLRGLAERVAAAGGVLQAGPLDGGGFRVHATVPGPTRSGDPIAPPDR